MITNCSLPCTLHKHKINAPCWCNIKKHTNFGLLLEWTWHINAQTRFQAHCFSLRENTPASTKKVSKTIAITSNPFSKWNIQCNLVNTKFVYRWGDMWRQCREDFHSCPSVCAHIIREGLLKFTVNRVIRTTGIKRSTLASSCVTIHWPIPCVCISILLSIHTHH